MKKRKIVINKTVLRILETFVYIIALAFALQMLVTLDGFSGNLIFTVFLLNTCAYILSAINVGVQRKIDFIKYLVPAITSFIITLLIVFYADSPYIRHIVFCVYAASVIFVRIIPIIKKRSVLRIVFNVLRILLWVCLVFCVLAGGKDLPAMVIDTVLGIAIPIQMLTRVTILSFSHIRYDILSKVVRKSMAVEILSGLMILIVSFSFGLTVIEPQIENYGDALWYCFAIVTTIGFGDITAVTVFGRVLSVILGLYGIIVVALITSIIVNFYTEVNNNPNASDKVDKSAPAENIPDEKSDDRSET